MERPLRHVSICVPWHDTAWDGRVCANPRLKGTCLKMKRIGQNRDDDAEEAIAGWSLEQLAKMQWLCCVDERVAFMAPFEYTKTKNHPCNRPDCAHGHFKETPLRHPPYCAAAIPFAWMHVENMARLADEHEPDVDYREPDLGFANDWVHDHRNQQALSEYVRMQPQHFTW